MFISQAFAQGGADAAAQAPMDPTIFNLGLIFILFIMFYFLLIRPQNKRMKEQRLMLDGLQKGDKVVTAGGIIGKIVKVVDEREVEVEIAKDVKVTLLRYAVQDVVREEASQKDAKEAKKTTKTTTKDKKNKAA